MMSVVKPEATSLVLVEEFSHRVLNEFTCAIAELNVVASQVCDETARRQLADAADRLHAHAHAHRVLAMPVVEASCDIAEYVARVCSAIANALRLETELRLELPGVDVVLSSDRCWRLALILSELIHNAARHGGRDGEIVVELSVRDAQLISSVSNNGPHRSAPTLGRGRRVVVELAKELDGRANWVFTPTGVRAWVEVPLV